MRTPQRFKVLSQFEVQDKLLIEARTSTAYQRPSTQIEPGSGR